MEISMSDVTWDYTKHAASYDKRADYSSSAVQKVLGAMGAEPWKVIADVGAGTGKLSCLLGKLGHVVRAVEPNDAMRSFGIKNSEGMPIFWTKGTGEQTGLPDSCATAVFFGSSFNVVDQPAALKETVRVLIPGGWFSCMWNHRSLEDPIQSEIEALIKKEVPDYNYGTRRQDPTGAIKQSGLFKEVSFAEDTFQVQMPVKDFVAGWESHATLERQAGPKFRAIISQIEKLLQRHDAIQVPYTTRIWYARAISKK
jgi:ubiquinone/menaquinone biosynthesis C-methylase UbiE